MSESTPLYRIQLVATQGTLAWVQCNSVMVVGNSCVVVPAHCDLVAGCMSVVSFNTRNHNSGLAGTLCHGNRHTTRIMLIYTRQNTVYAWWSWI